MVHTQMIQGPALRPFEGFVILWARDAVGHDVMMSLI
jgi:hypothetical protein